MRREFWSWHILESGHSENLKGLWEYEVGGTGVGLRPVPSLGIITANIWLHEIELDNIVSCFELILSTYHKFYFSLVLVRKGPSGKAQLVLLDHGLYECLPSSVRQSLCRLWKAIVTNNHTDMETYAHELGVKGNVSHHSVTNILLWL